MAQVAGTSSGAQGSGLRHLSLPQAVRLALQHNHAIRIAEARVDEKKHATEVARSAYLPTIRNESTALEVTDTQFIEIPAGGLGTVAPNQPIPNSNVILSQGGQHFITSGTGLTQPLTQLFKIRSANEMAKADYRASHSAEQSVEQDVALKVHEVYYQVLISQMHRKAAEAKIAATTELQKEHEQQVRLGSALEEDLIEARAQSLQAKQDLLSIDLQISDLTSKMNDLIGLPMNTVLALEDVAPEVRDICERAACIESARASHPEISQVRAEVEKAAEAVRLAKQEYIPDVTGFARYSHQENVPFLARNFGTFGVEFDYTLFDGGRRRATVREAESALTEARETLARTIDEVDLGVEIAYNKLDRTREMVKVSQELLSLREESSRVTAQQLARGNALGSQADSAAAQALQARTQLLQSQLDLVQARDELTRAIGRIPE
jgi:outer membrane protein TolC